MILSSETLSPIKAPQIQQLRNGTHLFENDLIRVVLITVQEETLNT